MIPARQPVDFPAGARFEKRNDATGREYLVDKLTGAWTPVAELTTNAPVSPLRDGEDAAMYQRPSAHHPSATTSHKKRGRDEMGPFRTGKPADDDTSIVSSENSQKSLHDEVAQLRARLTQKVRYELRYIKCGGATAWLRLGTLKTKILTLQAAIESKFDRILPLSGTPQGC